MTNKTQIARKLRQQQTEAEKELWKQLRNRKIENLKFRRQHPLKEYIVDFFCEAYGIVIELDGQYHNQKEQIEKDNLRDRHLTTLGYCVLRFENEAVLNKSEFVLKLISNSKKKQEQFFIDRQELLAQRKKRKEKHLTPALSSRRGSKRILSTKKLSLSQKELLLNAKVSFVEYDAIKIEHLDFNLESGFDYYLFTSQNAVKSYLKKSTSPPSSVGEGLGVKAFCVGSKTKDLLEISGFEVIETAQSALELAEIIVKNYQNKSFLFFTGNLRRNELPKVLTENNIRYDEVETYRTQLVEKTFERKFDGILFFSPSAVQSFLKENKIENSFAFCIGETTASEAKKYTDKIIIANKPTIENVLVQAIKHIKRND